MKDIDTPENNHLSPAALQEEALKRSRKQPLLQKIVKVFKGEKHFKELILNTEMIERRMALLLDGVLEKFEVERNDEDRMVGAIFRGEIQNLEPGLKAAFVDIGQEKNAFLHYWDMLPAANDTIEVVRENQKVKPKAITLADIPKMYPIGKDIVVQITKGQIGTKGPRTTTNIAIPGRFLVLMPFSGQCGISHKIEDRRERERLKKIVRSLTIPDGMGVIVRTAGEGKKIRYFVRDLHILINQWQGIQHEIDSSKKPKLVYQEPDLIDRTVRDFLTEDIDRVLVDNEADYERMIAGVEQISPRSKSKIARFKEDIPIFERFNIERQIEQTTHRRVPLPSGGEIVIEETEALTAVDVNTGSHKSDESRDFIVQANIEAAVEICRQVLLRNIGGLIIIDFIDMKSPRQRISVWNVMRREMAKDKAKTQILPISALGILQMTRQRHSESNLSGIYTCCPYCEGRGKIKSARSVSVEIQRKLKSLLQHSRKKFGTAEKLKWDIRVHPSVFERLRSTDKEALLQLESDYNALLSFRAEPHFHVELYKILDSESQEELK
ncbi:MAG TPA: ribonuclease E/G [Opitutae bacterium]|nr:ribonuclease E/G [Opitutae bacterium]